MQFTTGSGLAHTLSGTARGLCLVRCSLKQTSWWDGSRDHPTTVTMVKDMGECLINAGKQILSHRALLP